ncbi:MAG TPA: bifunctional DNA primase/polymerase [Actinomycetota bacterium]|nr:bifunctional DNA primase/polymerase [Actinomycetota bacterium]
MTCLPVPAPTREPARVGPGALLAALGEDLAPGRAAEVYAALGYPVLPCFEPTPGGGCACCAGAGCRRAGKHPRLRASRPGVGGVHEATSDLATVRRWWRRWPAANVAIRTGPGSFDVADIDGPQGVEALRAILHNAPGVLGSGPLARSGGGGWHVLFRPSGLGCQPPTTSAGVVLAGVDWRGRGGYVLVWPSRHFSGNRYRWVRPLGAELPAVPAALRELLEPARPGTPRPQVGPWAVGGGYGAAALASECARLAAVAPGGHGRPGRNRALYMAALRLGRLAAAGHLEPAEITAALGDVARSVGLSGREIGPTIASGLRNGTAHPRADLPSPPQQGTSR